MTALYWNIPTQVNYDNLFSGIVDYGDFLLLLPILVVIATSLFFTETDNDTLKNLTTIPVSKGKIVVAKIGVMAIISVSYTLLGFCQYVVFKNPWYCYGKHGTKICIEYRIGNNALSRGFTLCGISCMVQ